MTEELREGTVIGDYEIVSVAGSGGMGVVYRARQRSLDRVVALKVIGDAIASSEDYRDRFLREARLAASVDHPHVVSVYDVGEQDGRLYLTMQWVDGEDLRSLLDREGAMSPERAIGVVEQLAGALGAVHDAGLIHRDVKPANVLLRQMGERDHAYLTDFGIAKDPNLGLDNLTRTGWVVGTAGYLSPEQIMGHPPDSRSDLYAMACLAFELMSGKAPFSASNEMALRWAHANSPRPQASLMRPALGQRYDGFFMQALSVDPTDRFRSGRAFAAALASAHASNEPHSSPPPPTAPAVRHAQRMPEPAAAPTATAPAPTAPAAPTQPTQVQPSPPTEEKAHSGRMAPRTPAAASEIPGEPPVAPARRSGNRSPILIAVALLALASAGAGAAVVLSRSPGQAKTQSDPTRTIISVKTVIATSPASTPSSIETTTPKPPTATVATEAAPSKGRFSSTGVTGRDGRGFNYGPGCSDDPASTLPGCSDSPDVPAGDPHGGCRGGTTVDRATTSCGLAESVRANYTGDGLVTAMNAQRTRRYQFNCQTGGPGTTGLTICLGQEEGSPLYLRWRR